MDNHRAVLTADETAAKAAAAREEEISKAKSAIDDALSVSADDSEEKYDFTPFNERVYSELDNNLPTKEIVEYYIRQLEPLSTRADPTSISKRIALCQKLGSLLREYRNQSFKVSPKDSRTQAGKSISANKSFSDILILLVKGIPSIENTSQRVQSQATKAEIEAVFKSVFPALTKTLPKLDALPLTFAKYAVNAHRTSSDYMTRLVRRRLEDLGQKDLIVDPDDLEQESPSPHEKQNGLTPEKRATRLMIMKRFIQCFGCCSEIPYPSRSTKGIGFYCEKIKQIAEAKYENNYEKMAQGLTEAEYLEILFKVKQNSGKTAPAAEGSSPAEPASAAAEPSAVSDDPIVAAAEVVTTRTGKAVVTPKKRGRKKKTDAERANEVKPDRTKMASIADDLAAACFSGQHTTRESLYIFAIAFDMTFSARPCGSIKSDDPDYRTDIEKNLFCDYYADNLLNPYRRYSEQQVDGYGINYRNAAEIIYLYHLNPACPIEPRSGETSELARLRSAREMITECTGTKISSHTWRELNSRNAPRAQQATLLYKRDFFTRLLKMPPAELMKYISENFVTREFSAAPIYYDRVRRTATLLADRITVATRAIETGIDEEASIGDMFEAPHSNMYKGLTDNLNKKLKISITMAANAPLNTAKKSAADASIAETTEATKDGTKDDAKENKTGSPDRYDPAEVSRVFSEIIAGNQINRSTLLIACCKYAAARYVAGIWDLTDYPLSPAMNDSMDSCSRFFSHVCNELPVHLDFSDSDSIHALLQDETAAEEKAVDGASVEIQQIDETLKSLSDQAEDIKGINGILALAGYQPVSSKNLLDMMLLVTTYQICFREFLKYISK